MNALTCILVSLVYISWFLTQPLHAAPVLPVLSQPIPITYPAEVDLGVDGIIINFRMSTEEVLGKHFRMKAESDDLSVLTCYSADNREELTLFQHADGPENSFQEFHLSMASAEFKPEISAIPACRLSPKQFTTYRGVRLGMSINDIISIFGDNYRIESKSGEIKLIYALESNIRSPFLQHYKRQKYFGHYHFRSGRLIALAFGFDRRY